MLCFHDADECRVYSILNAKFGIALGLVLLTLLAVTDDAETQAHHERAYSILSRFRIYIAAISACVLGANSTD
jgi:hypothetical protein